MKQLRLLLVLLVSSLSVFAQRNCGYETVMEKDFIENPQNRELYLQGMERLKNLAENARMNRSANQTSAVVTIPVVVHVLYKTTAQNISLAQINSQLAVLNADFRKQNSDFNAVVPSVFRPFAADLEIQFVLATTDPMGNPTDGVTRKSVSSSFNLETSYYLGAGQPSWDPYFYLNIWVGDFGSGSDTLGFAWPPIPYAGTNRDGLVIGFRYFGTMGTAQAPFNKGRTATHEIGHYFGLEHPWGTSTTCGSPANNDGANDVPAVNGPHYGCPTFPTNTNTCTNSANGAMFMNFMDYVNDGCMGMFTTNQKAIAREVLEEIRVDMFLSTKQPELSNSVMISPNPTKDIFKIKANEILGKVEIFDTTGKLVKKVQPTNLEESINISELENGVYYLRIYSNSGFLKSDKIIKS